MSKFVVHCSVHGCLSSADNIANIDNMTFHRFPRAKHVKKIWIRATGRKNWKPNYNDHICSIHFKEISFIQETGRLKSCNEIPCRYLPKMTESKVESTVESLESMNNEGTYNLTQLDSKQNDAIKKLSDDLIYEHVRSKYIQFVTKTKHRKYDIAYFYLIMSKMLKREDDPEEDKQSSEEAYYNSKFELLTDEHGEQYLIKKRKNPQDPELRYIALEHTFDILFKLHVSNNHANRKKMRSLTNDKYIVNQMYIDFILLSCNICCGFYKKISKPEMLGVHKPLINLRRTVFVDLIDFKIVSDGDFQYLLVYKDVRTSFVILRPLATQCHFDVASELIKIFTSFGPPDTILINQFFTKFYTKVIKHLEILGSTARIPLKRMPKHKLPSNDFIMTGIQEWMLETGSNHWGIGCHIVQWRLNNDNVNPAILVQRAYNNNLDLDTTDKSPHLCMFGNVPFTNAQSSLENDIFYDFCQNITSEKSKKMKRKAKKTNKPPVKLTSKVCHVCECKMAREQGYICDLCQKAVHLFCSERSIGSDSDISIYKCFTCSDKSK